MHCQNCGVQLPQGAQICPNCRAAVPNSNYQSSSGFNQQSQMPPTTYGSSPNYYQPSDPYHNSGVQSPEYAPPPPATPVPQYPPVSQPQYQPVQQVPQYQQPVSQVPQYQPPVYQVPPTPPRKNNTGIIIGAIAGVLIVAIIVGALIAFAKIPPKQANNNNNNNNTSQHTPTATQEAQTKTGPSGNKIDPNAAQIITNAQTASAIDETTTEPTTLATTFKKDSLVYLTFRLSIPSDIDPTKTPVYVQAKFYIDKDFGFKDDLKFDSDSGGGYFSAKYHRVSQGQAELYWCKQSDCSDAKLAQVVSFSVTA